MKQLIPLTLIFLALVACKPSPPKQEVVPEAPISHEGFADSLHGPMDTTVKVPTPKETVTSTSAPHVTDHICSPNFTLLAKPTKNHQIYYVTGFDPTEFRCWQALENHGNSISNKKPFIIDYVDDAKVSINSTAPDFMDKATLTQHAIGRYSHDGAYYEVNGGSRIWKRQGKGYDYYNTDNHLGG